MEEKATLIYEITRVEMAVTWEGGIVCERVRSSQPPGALGPNIS